jgi:ESS family glutamate:Na+ symporter
MNRVDIGSMDMLSLSILVLFIGAFLNRKIGILRDNFIPPAVTGGILFSGGATLLYFTMDIEFTFDMRLRDLCLLFFFTTIGLSARLRALAAGGRAIFKLVIIAAVFLVVQDVTGVALAMLIGESPAYIQ